MARGVEKDAVVYLLDCSETMQVASKDGERSFFEVAKEFICRAVEVKLYSETKNQYLFITFGHGGDDRPASKSGGVEVKDHLSSLSLKFLNSIWKQKTSNSRGNLTTAIQSAVDIFYGECFGLGRPKKIKNLRLLIFTNFRCAVSPQEITKVLPSFEERQVELVFMCDQDLSDLTTKESLNAEEENVKNCLAAIQQYGHCSAFSCSQAITSLIYEPTIPNSAKQSYSLTIGDTLSISVSAYIKVTRFTPKNLKIMQIEPLEEKKIESPSQPTTSSEPINFEIPSDPSMILGLKTSVEFEDPNDIENTIEKTYVYEYKYGTTLVPITAEDRDAMNYLPKEKGFQLLHFTPLEYIKPYYKIGDKSLIVGVEPKCSAKEKAAFDSLVRACVKLKCVAIVRYVPPPRKTIHVGCLYPMLEEDFVGWTYIELPFAGDLRDYSILFDDKSNNVPSKAQADAVAALVESMDLDGCPSFNTYFPDPNYTEQFQSILANRIEGYKPLNVIDPITSLDSQSMTELSDRLFSVFPVEISSKKRSIFVNDEEQTPPKKLKAEAVLTDINLGYSAPDEMFKRIVKKGDFRFFDVCTKLEERLLELIDSEAESNEALILGSLKVYRDEARKRGDVKGYNSFIAKLENILNEHRIWSAISDKKLLIIPKTE